MTNIAERVRPPKGQIKAPPEMSKAARQNYRRRVRLGMAFKFHCAYCNEHTPLEVGTIDEYRPRALGGTRRWGNIVWACKPCNEAKADKMPAGVESVFFAKGDRS